MNYIDNLRFQQHIITAIEYYNHIKDTRIGGIVDFGSNESDIKIGKNVFKNVLIRPIDENNVILNLKYNNIIIKHQFNGEFIFDKDDENIDTIWISGKNIPAIYSKIKKINSEDDNVKSFSFMGTDLTNFDGLRFETDLTLDYHWNNARDIKDFSGLNNCRMPILRLFGCWDFTTINKLKRESVPIINLMMNENQNLNFELFKYRGLKLETIMNEDGSQRIISVNPEFSRSFNEYLEFIKAHPDVYDNSIKSRIFNEVYPVYLRLNSRGTLHATLLEIFEKEFNDWGLSLNDAPIDKVKNRLIDLLLK